jgi:enoyl-CoA hydratase/carnithine racemase
MVLITDLSEHVFTIRLNRPEQHNAIDPELRSALKAAWNEFRDNEDAWVAILTGTGDKAFCAGSDLGRTGPPKENFAHTMLATPPDELWRPLQGLWKPVIAAINGYAFGGGLELALACDIRIASTHAVFAQSEVKVGSMVGAGGSVRLLRAVPHAIAMKMLLTGCRIDAAEAHRVGLVSDVAAPEALMERAQQMALDICQNAPLSVRATKMAAVVGQSMTEDQALQVERLLWGTLRDTEDRSEGRKAFSEKRKPEWRGK